MTIRDCIVTAREGGELTDDEARDMLALYDNFNRQARADLGDDAAAAAAADALAEVLRGEAMQKRRQANLTIERTAEIKRNLDNYRTAKGEQDVGNAMLRHLENFGEAPYSSVEGRKDAIIGRTHARLEELLHRFRKSAIAGVTRNRPDLDDVVRELHGANTGNGMARGFAEAWTAVAEGLRKRFNAAGGAIARLEDWGLPHIHDAKRLRRAGREAWKEYIKPRIDPARMRHPLTGKPVAEAELDNVLDHVWHSIAMEGWNTRAPSRQAFGRGALANQRAQHRFLVFKDADQWLEYQGKFGTGNPFAAMMQHVNVMARDIASMEVLGPNPQATLEWLKQVVRKEAAEAVAGRPSRFAGSAKRALSRANGKIKRLDDMWAHMRGSTNIPVNSTLANGVDAARNVITSSVLGSATITAVFTDLGFQKVARAFAGIPATKAITDIIKEFRVSSRREAVQSSLILDSAMNVFHRQARYVGSLAGPEWANWLADRTLTFSGLTPWTQAGRHAFGMSFQAFTASQRRFTWNNMDPTFKRTFERYGLTEADWEVIRTADLYEPRNGARFLRPNEIAQLADGPALDRVAVPLGIDEADRALKRDLVAQGVERVAERYLEMIQSETQFAVPSGSVQARSILPGNAQAGTVAGSFWRSASMFKSFSVVIALLQSARIWREINARPARGAAYAGALLISTAIGGALSLQFKQVIAGRDLRPMDNVKFWAAAVLQGGSLGIYGDFLFADLNRYGRGFPTTAAGPLVERLDNIWNLTGGNVVQFAGGDDTKFGREAVRFLRGNTPLLTSLWYMRLGYERLVLDQLQYLVDPEANRNFKRRIRFWDRQFDQGFYWEPGTTSPQRAPDLGRALGN